MSEHKDIEAKPTDQDSSEARRRRMILETSMDGFCMVGPDGRILEAYSSLCDITGYSKEELLTMRIADLEAQMTPDEIIQRIDKIRAQGYDRFETRQRRKTGEIIDLEVSAQYCNLDGEGFFFCFIRDITDLKLSQNSLQKSEGLYRTLCSNIAGMVYRGRTDWSTKIISNSEAVCGYCPEDIDSNRVKWFDIIHPDDRERVLNEASKLEAKPSTAVQEYRIIAKDGSVRWVEDHKTSTFTEEGVFDGVDGIVFDITEVKKGREDLKASEARFRTLSEAAFEGIAIHKNRRIFDANQKFIEMFGYTPEELGNLDGIQLIAADFREGVMEDIDAGQEGSYETIGLKKDGSEFPIEVQARVMQSQGDVLRIVAVRDLSLQKQLEAERARDKEQVFKAQRHAYIGSMGAIVAHQVNQPLTKMNILLDRSMDKAGDGSCCPEVIRDVEESLAQVKEAISIIRKFRDYAGDSSLGGMDMVNLSTVAERIVSILSAQAKQAKMRISTKGLSDLPEVEANGTALEQIILIIVQNAIEAADGQKSHRLAITGKCVDGNIELRFADDCCGVARENLDRIFEPFFSTKVDDKGLGLGLDIAQQILISCGGHIRVESETGKGSTFYVTLPISHTLES